MERFSKEWADSQAADKDGRRIIRSHYWRRVFSTDIRCGDCAEVKISAKAGVSETTLTEVAGSLEITVGVLKSILSPKLGESATVSEERVIEFTHKLSSRPCRGLTFAEWQKIERVTIRQPRRVLIFSFGFRENTVENRTEDFCPDYCEYPVPECCPEDFERKLSAGFTQLYGVSFGGLTSIAHARPLADGKIVVSGVPGVFTPGQSLQLDQFAEYFRDLGLSPTTEAGRLSSSLGPATSLLGRSQNEKALGSGRTKWVFLMAGVFASLVYALSRKKRKHGVSEILETGQSDIAGALERGKQAYRESIARETAER